MAGIRIKVKTRAGNNAIEKAADGLINLSEPFSTIASLALEAIVKRFQERKGSTGTTWQPLSEKYAIWKATYKANLTKKGTKRKRKVEVDPGNVSREATLEFNGALIGSFQEDFTPNQASVSTSVEYAAAHNYGFPGRKLPQREFMFFTPNEEETFTKVIDDFLFQEN